MEPSNACSRRTVVSGRTCTVASKSPAPIYSPMDHGASTLRIPPNRSGRDFVAGDVHGEEKKSVDVPWGIELPVDAMSPGKVWLIVQRGWTIWTRFDINAEDGREHLDYYAMHRMIDDRHGRLYADGEKEDLPAMAGSYATSPDATKAEQEAVRAKFFADNQAVEKLLEEKGFVMTDQAHGSAQINRFFQTRPDAEGPC